MKESEKYGEALSKKILNTDRIEGMYYLMIPMFIFDNMVELAERYLEALKKEQEDWAQK